ncbi:MAG: ATP-binding cassette domain-containing protein, partial [Nitrospiraceae bacterium]|nr:ATP-binding cassette domain-containing protein [Nitrospiraceae bacterium]
LSKSFGDVEICKGFNLSVMRGDKIAIVGPNGAGKTTLIKMLLQGVEQAAGDVRPRALRQELKEQAEQLALGRRPLHIQATGWHERLPRHRASARKNSPTVASLAHEACRTTHRSARAAGNRRRRAAWPPPAAPSRRFAG